jgi:hypothetical protein
MFDTEAIQGRGQKFEVVERWIAIGGIADVKFAGQSFRLGSMMHR